MATCSAVGCSRAGIAKGLCTLHYQRAKKGKPLDGPEKAPAGSHLKFLRSLRGHVGDACVFWPFAANVEGYGVVRFRGRSVRAHRFVCEEEHGAPAFEKAEACHSCGKGHLGCVNPRHLRWGTSLDNHEDMRLHGTVCRGEARASVLTEEKVMLIDAELRLGRRKIDIARQFGVNDTRIHRIANGAQWGWLTGRAA